MADQRVVEFENEPGASARAGEICDKLVEAVLSRPARPTGSLWIARSLDVELTGWPRCS